MPVLSRESVNVAPSTVESPRLMRLGDLLGEWQADAEAAHLAHSTGALRGPVTRLATLDRELGGALAPGVHILHAGPGAGKTALGVQVAASCGFPCLYVTAEMSPLELFKRHTARVTDTFLGKLRSGELVPRVSLDLARQAAARAPFLAFVDATQAFAEPAWLHEVAEALRGDQEHLLIVVDSVHSWAEAANTGSEYEQLGEALGSLRKMAGALNCPILAIAERNRPSMKDGGMSASAGTRKFEYGGSSVMELNRKAEDQPDANGEVPVTLTLAKNRNGVAGKKIRLAFHGALQRFREV